MTPALSPPVDRGIWSGRPGPGPVTPAVAGAASGVRDGIPIPGRTISSPAVNSEGRAAPEAVGDRPVYHLGPFHWVSRSMTSPAYVLPMYLLVLLGVAVVADAFSRAPVPPGVDPGHWLAAAYSYVGLPTAPDPANQALVYSPLMFPFLGGLVRLTGDPLVAASVFAVGLFLLYGLTTILVARRFLVSGPLQVALVGLAMFCGSTLQMLFWGGYPNLLGFACMNVAMVLLVLYFRTHRGTDGAAFFAMVAVTFFAHDLTFALLVASVGLATLFLLLLGKTSLRFVFSLPNILGLVLVGVVLEGYNQVTARLGIPHPSYYFSNPAAYTIDEVGEIFRPLGHAPAFLPAGPIVVLPPLPTALLLVSAPLVALLALGFIRLSYPGRVDTRLVVAAGWLAAAFAVPGAGYLAHVDTDYSRFLYFIPFPFVLVVLATVERAAPQVLAGGLVALPPGPSLSERWNRLRRWRWESPRPGSTAAMGVVVFVVLLLVFTSVTLPVVAGNEAAGTSSAHDQAFVDAMQWLKAAPPGNVLTTPSAARWTEALSLRAAYTVGPVWLLFQPFQIGVAQESYWALTSEATVTNNHVALSYSGFATPVMSQAPMYTAYVQGVAFPALRVLPGSLTLNATSASGLGTTSAAGGGTPQLTVPGPTPTSGVIRYSSSVAQVEEIGLVNAGGSASILFVVTPVNGAVVHSFGLTLGGPPGESTTFATDSVTGVQYSNGVLTWQVGGHLGQYPYPVNVTTKVAFSELPATASSAVVAGAQLFTASFPDGNGSAPFTLRLDLATPGASNPTGVLPPVIRTSELLQNESIHFLLWPNKAFGSAELTYYQSTFGFRPAYANSEWVIYEH